MKIRIEHVPLAGQAWIDTLDYHVRAAVEAEGLSMENFTQGEEWVESPEVASEVAERIREALKDVPRVKVTTV